MAISGPLQTSRLRVVPFADRHLTGRYVGWLNDGRLMRYSEQRHRRHSLDTCREYMASFRETPHFFWAIEEVTLGLGHVGNVNAYVDPGNLLADVGLLIGERDAASKGYGLEAWVAVCHFLFCGVGVRKVTGGTVADNVAMVRIMSHAGMVEDGQRVRHYLLDGREVDVLHMALFRDQWDRMCHGEAATRVSEIVAEVRLP